jgi:hypothetical protein
VARPLTTALHAHAVVLARDFKLSFYDALIVAAAVDAGCELALQRGSAGWPEIRCRNCRESVSSSARSRD